MKKHLNENYSIHFQKKKEIKYLFTLFESEIIKNWDSNLVSYIRLFSNGIWGFTFAPSSNLILYLQKQNT